MHVGIPPCGGRSIGEEEVFAKAGPCKIPLHQSQRELRYPGKTFPLLVGKSDDAEFLSYSKETQKHNSNLKTQKKYFNFEIYASVVNSV